MIAEAEWDRLAQEVAATLTRAGITARVSERVSEEMPTGGATITIEALGDAGDGVYVTWNPHPSLDSVVRRAVESLDLSSRSCPSRPPRWRR
jgi:hypothetical protein